MVAIHPHAVDLSPLIFEAKLLLHYGLLKSVQICIQ